MQAHADVPWDVDHGQSQAKAKHSAKHVCVGKHLALGCCERGNGRHREGVRGKCPLISYFAAVIMSSMGCLFTKIQPRGPDVHLVSSHVPASHCNFRGKVCEESRKVLFN